MSTKKLTSNSLKDLTFTESGVKIVGASAVSKVNADGTETKLQPIDSTAKKVTKKPVKAVAAETKPVKATTKPEEDKIMATETKTNKTATTVPANETKPASDIEKKNKEIMTAAEQMIKDGKIKVHVETESAGKQFLKGAAAGAGVAAGALTVAGLVKLGIYLLSSNK